MSYLPQNGTAIPVLLQKYEVIKTLGRGNFGVVHVVRSKEDRRVYVMKEVHMVGMRQEERDCVSQEAVLLSKMEHPFIVRYIESVFSQPHTLCLIMEYCQGGDLSALIQQRQDVLREAIDRVKASFKDKSTYVQ
jgi:serine/threonine protein kinase